MTTLEDAKRCPRCGEPGEENGMRPAGPGAVPGTKMLTVLCRVESCRWFGTGWVIQINPDGTIPEANTKQEKAYPKLGDSDEVADAAIKQMELQAELETRGQAEIRNPHSP